MADSYLVEPDVSFIKEVVRLGGADVKKCFQCATCAVACPISPDTKPFPRKEMIATSWGLKDRLIGNGDVWLCHNCGDCSTLCPRGAKPADVLGAVRAATVIEYAKPKSIAKMVSDPKKLPILLTIPAVIILVLGLLFKIVGINWLNFAPVGEHLWQSDYINNYLVDIIMIPTFLSAIAIFALGLKRFVADMHANALKEGKTNKEKIDPIEFAKTFVKVLPTIMKHERFNECSENKERSTAHMMVLFSFIGLFIVTACFFIGEWVFHIEGPYQQINPIKWLANISGICLVIGGILLLKNRLDKKDQISSYWDWYLIGLVLTLGITGMLTEMLRLNGSYGLSAIIYFLHLISVWVLFAYTPFSKLAHIVYRTVAMTYQEYSGRK
ncbi:quinone-interacting membrane-bound oxidoreductase complex subunit QmoC [Desulfosarcina sp. OttesenSCG-928-A07]|nr:quinone-interacting membrane-bound oxidoreductase complex subunit QmoC [Desulfosarcina sp. OttesenSCG-928-G17]MDL2328735.1 quinone-interacting membrane-bound oxidoreductase complex subunit QmoC [Desulfosarcina sp. OttesenSCG-928-A07]